MSTETAVFGGGCFWCTEAVFKMLKGVTSVEPGYAGGSMGDPTYEEVSSGDTGHAEVVKINFDPAVVPFETLLTIFFATHDSTTLNRQGADVGTQYRSAIFYTTAGQKEKAEKFIADLERESTMGGHITTEVTPFTKFYPAEEYHRDYFARNPEQSYCQIVINPKLKKVQEKFAELLKNS
jgi:peptide-methionine (S)-S-oxide reductase